MEGACAGKVNPGMLYNGLHRTPMISDKVLKLGFKHLQKDGLGRLETMGLLNGPVKLHLSSMEIIHGNLMGVQHVPNRAQGESGLLKPLAQLLKRFGLRRTIHMTMCTHSINLNKKLDQSSINQRPIKPLT